LERTYFLFWICIICRFRHNVTTRSPVAPTRHTAIR
jgi:hypothetical protein